MNPLLQDIYVAERVHQTSRGPIAVLSTWLRVELKEVNHIWVIYRSLFLAEFGRENQYAAIYQGPLRSFLVPNSDMLDGRWALVVPGTNVLIDSMERDDHGQRHDVAKGTMGAYINSSMVTGCAGSLLKGGNCKRVWFRHQYTDEFISRNPQLVQMALALTCETLPNTELLYPYPWKKQFQFSGEAQEASDGQMSKTNSLVANDPQITARLASGANSCVDVQGYPAAIPDKRGLPKAARPLAGGAARQPSLPREPCG